MDLAKDIKTQDDLAKLSSTLLKMTVEAHLDYAKHTSPLEDSDNGRNGYSCKCLKVNHS